MTTGSIVFVVIAAIVVFYLLFYCSGFVWRRGYDYGYKKGYMRGGTDCIGMMAGLLMLTPEEREELKEQILAGADPLELLKNKLKDKGV